jgi:hypothetical protein
MKTLRMRVERIDALTPTMRRLDWRDQQLNNKALMEMP